MARRSNHHRRPRSDAKAKAGAGLTAVLALTIACTAAVLQTDTARATVSGISYEIAPAIEYMDWDEETGLDGGPFYGGLLSINFGRYLGLQGYYLRNDDTESSFEATGLELPVPFSQVDRDVDIDTYGGDIFLNLAEGDIIPYLKAGGGVLEFDPAGASAFRTINLRAGAGLRFGLGDRLLGTVYVEDSMFRINRANMLPGDTEADLSGVTDPDPDELRHNLLVGAGVSFFLGGYDAAEETELDEAFRNRYESGLSGLSIPVEPFVGRLVYADDVGLGDQEFAGVRTGIDFGPLFGLRAYYWRGMKSDFDDTDDVHSWGGEAQFNLSSGPGISPYLLLGVGQLDYESDFATDEGVTPDDKTALILGGGLDMAVGDRVNVKVSVRDYIFGMSELEDSQNPDDLHNNLSYAVGLSVSLGGGAPDSDRIDDIGRRQYGRPASAERTADEESAERRDEMARDRARDGAKRDGDRATRVSDGPEPRYADDAPQPFTDRGRQMIYVPVPETGEVYLRYGEPGGVSIRSMNRSEQGTEDARTTSSSVTPRDGADVDIDSIESVVTRAVRRELDKQEGSSGDVSERTQRTLEALEADRAARAAASDSDDALTSDRLELMERRIADRIQNSMQQELDGLRASIERMSLEDDLQRQPTTVVPQMDQDIDAPDERTRREQPIRSNDDYDGRDRDYDDYAQAREDLDRDPYGEFDRPGLELNQIRTFTGASLNEPNQWILGGRLDLGPIRQDSSFRFEPEIAYGAGDNASFMVAANLTWRASDSLGDTDVAPYVYGGFGILNFADDPGDRDGTEGVLNLGYGLSKDLGNLRGFLEHQGLDLFSINRLLFGVSFNM